MGSSGFAVWNFPHGSWRHTLLVAPGSAGSFSLASSVTLEDWPGPQNETTPSSFSYFRWDLTESLSRPQSPYLWIIFHTWELCSWKKNEITRLNVLGGAVPRGSPQESGRDGATQSQTLCVIVYQTLRLLRPRFPLGGWTSKFANFLRCKHMVEISRTYLSNLFVYKVGFGLAVLRPRSLQDPLEQEQM